MTDYEEAKIRGLINTCDGTEHHPMSIRLMEFLSSHDFNDYDDYFCFKMGGDGDNGEILMQQMDVFFKFLDMKEK